jgi:uncharacterized Zn finger protein
MALSKCPSCDNHYFELVLAEPGDSLVKMHYIQCSACGTVVGVTDYYDTASYLEEKLALR